MKELKSGIKVDASKYYKLLEWKDTHWRAFEMFLDTNNIGTYSINNFSLSQYNELLKYSKI